jgi:protocatechuate 3,4-dioxygenase beta subunit
MRLELHQFGENMFELIPQLLVRGRQVSCALLLFCLLIFTACSAVDPVAETPLSTSSVLIPLIEQADAVSDEQDETASSGQADIVSPEQTGTSSSESADTALPEIDCTSPAKLMLAQAEGPYYTSDTPERTSLLETGMGGTRLTLTGYVLNQDCQPIPGAWLDFWQADDQGVYDNVGYRLRGHQFTDANGRYQLETIIPGEYPGRPPHIHVKVQAPGGPVLTTQLYFPGSAGNESDPIFSSETLLSLQESENGYLSIFNFIVGE